MIDQRLLGSWKSDKRRTLQDLRKFKGISERTIRLLGKKIYGRLIHRWERRILKTSMDGEAFSSQEYSVLAKDDSSVAVMIAGDPESWLDEKNHILHVRFEGRDRYWIPVLFRPGLSREWFRRVEKRGVRGPKKK